MSNTTTTSTLSCCDPASIGMEGRLSVDPADVDAIAAEAAAWEQAGATHLSINTMQAGRSSVDEHIAALAAAAEVLL